MQGTATSRGTMIFDDYQIFLYFVCFCICQSLSRNHRIVKGSFFISHYKVFCKNRYKCSKRLPF